MRIMIAAFVRTRHVSCRHATQACHAGGRRVLSPSQRLAPSCSSASILGCTAVVVLVPRRRGASGAGRTTDAACDSPVYPPRLFAQSMVETLEKEHLRVHEVVHRVQGPGHFLTRACTAALTFA